MNSDTLFRWVKDKKKWNGHFMSANATAHTGNNSVKARAEVWQVKDCGLPAHEVIPPQLLIMRQSKR
jgi:hypothetical protein